MNAGESAAAYGVAYGDQVIDTTEKRSVTESFTYLTLLIADLEDVTVKLYDSGGGELMDVRFDTSTQQLVSTISGT